MMLQRTLKTSGRLLLVGIVACSMLAGLARPAAAQMREANPDRPVVESQQSGAWSEPQTWSSQRVPGAGDRVLVRQGHRVTYDVESTAVIRGISLSGTLTFARDRDTLLNVGLIRIEAGDQYSEDGFDCHHVPNREHHSHAHAPAHEQGGPPSHGPALEIGTLASPIAAERRAVIRLHFVPDMNRENCPAIVCCGGRMDLHGAPLERTWVKLRTTAAVGATRLLLAEKVNGWREGDLIVVTGTAAQEFVVGTADRHVTDRPSSEVRKIAKLDVYGGRGGMLLGSPQVVEIDAPLTHEHFAEDEFAGEVANLTRNVVIESAEPEGDRGHTMYHAGSSGGISYAEFRHLGKRGVLGKYPIHYHLVGDSMRGSSVIGASVWDSHNRWVTIHGTQYLVVRDCVGYRSVGHGYFLEDGTETCNVLDRNLAIQAVQGEPLPKQVLPFDRNDAAGFWWANSLNAWTRNVAVECDQHGFRFEVEPSDAFDPVLTVMLPSGDRTSADLRTLPFLRFEGNEAHCHRRFGLNLGGIRGMTYPELIDGRDRKSDPVHAVQGSVGGVGPDRKHPFHIRDFKVWDTHWAFHCGAPSVVVDGLNVYDCNYGIWRSTIDLHRYDNLSFRRIHAHSIFFPTGGYGPEIGIEDGRASYPSVAPVDDQPPVTIVTHIVPQSTKGWLVRGTTVDDNDVVDVIVNGVPARPLVPNFQEWEVTLPPGSDAIQVEAWGTDAAGNAESRPHRHPS